MIVTWHRDGRHSLASYAEIRAAEQAGEPLALRVIHDGRQYLIASAAGTGKQPVGLVPLERGARATWCATISDAIHCIEAATAEHEELYP